MLWVSSSNWWCISILPLGSPLSRIPFVREMDLGNFLENVLLTGEGVLKCDSVTREEEETTISDSAQSWNQFRPTIISSDSLLGIPNHSPRLTLSVLHPHVSQYSPSSCSVPQSLGSQCLIVHGIPVPESPLTHEWFPAIPSAESLDLHIVSQTSPM